MRPFSVLLAVFGAAAAGLAAGMLYAPKKGSDTRESIKDFIKRHCPELNRRHLADLVTHISDEMKQST